MSKYENYFDPHTARGYQDCGGCGEEFNQQKMPEVCHGCWNMICIECCKTELLRCCAPHAHEEDRILCANCAHYLTTTKYGKELYICKDHRTAKWKPTCQRIQKTNGKLCSNRVRFEVRFCKRHKRIYNKKK